MESVEAATATATCSAEASFELAFSGVSTRPGAPGQLRWRPSAVGPVASYGLLEPLQTLGPTRLVQRAARLGREWPLVDDELCCRATEERERHYRLLVVGIRLLPNERVDKAPRRIDLAELAAQVEDVSVRRLHSDAVPPSVADVKLKAGSGEVRRTPPLRQLLGLNASCEHALKRCLQDFLQMNAQVGFGSHEAIGS
jgi:hypothetical protein